MNKREENGLATFEAGTVTVQGSLEESILTYKHTYWIICEL
jgi:hypothetical protein